MVLERSVIEVLMRMLNYNNFQGHIDPQARCILEASGLVKKVVQSCPESCRREGRSHFCAQSVLLVREHGKMTRTPLAAFFNSPSSWKIQEVLTPIHTTRLSITIPARRTDPDIHLPPIASLLKNVQPIQEQRLERPDRKRDCLPSPFAENNF